MSLLSRSAERRSEYRTDAGIAPVRGKRFSLPAQSLSHNHCGGVGHPPSGLPDRGGERPPSQKITSTYPRSPIRAYPSRVLSGGNASGNLRKSGKDRRFGFTGRKTCAVGEVWLNGCALDEILKNVGAGGPRIASIAYQNTQDPRSRDRPSFPPFNSQTRQRAWQRENHIAAFPDGSCPPPARPLIFVDHERECDAV